MGNIKTLPDESNDNDLDVVLFENADEVGPTTVSSTTSKDNEKNLMSDKLRISILGDKNSPMVQAATAIYSHPKNTLDVFEDIDKLTESEPMLTIVCLDFDLNDNDTQDDVVLIDALNKIQSHTTGGILLKSIVSPETMIRILSALNNDSLEKRFAYQPDLVDSSNIQAVLNQEEIVIGASEEVFAAHSAVLNRNSNSFLKKLKGCTHLDAAIIKLAHSSYKAVKQTFFNQLYDYVSDFENANFNNLRISLEEVFMKNNATESLPSYVKVIAEDSKVSYKKAKSYKGEYDNKDIRAFVGATEKLTLLDECINYKNLKD